jgi:hypothetical protein
MFDFTIYTSIAPRGIANQQAAVNSWLHHGFRVVSLNVRDEIDVISPQMDSVVFMPVEHSGLQTFGKPLIYVDSVLNAARASDAEVFGIVNSDIHFDPETPLRDGLARMASRDLIYGTRMDVEDLLDDDGEEYVKGFDYFFLSREMTQIFPSSGLCIGAPFWDYWMPIRAIMNQREPIMLKNRIARHLRHETVWGMDQLIVTLKDIVEKSGIEIDGVGTIDFTQVNPRAQRFLGQFGPWIIEFIYKNSRKRSLRTGVTT